MAEEMHELYRRYVAAANARDYETIASLIHDDVMVNGVSSRRADVLASLAGFADVVPDFTWHIEDVLVAGDRIAARLRDTGTPAKRWLGMEPTNARIEITEFANYRVRDGRFAEMWFLMDTTSAAQQLILDSHS
jgi:predicted ester cyclase